MLSTEQLAYFADRLTRQRDDLQQRIDELNQQLLVPDAFDDAVQDRGEDGNYLAMRETIMGELAQAQQTLAQVERALRRIADGSYGMSEVSGEPIPIERLEALPSATTLVSERPPEE